MAAGIGIWIRATRPQFLTVSVVAVALKRTSVVSSGLQIHWGTALLTLLGAICMHAGANLINDFHDRDADVGNTDRLPPFTGGSRMIQDGLISARSMAVYGYALVGVTTAIGFGLAAAGNVRLLIVGAAGLVMAVAYSAPPLRLSARGCGEFVVAGAWLLVVVGADLVQRGVWSLHAVLAGVPMACLVAAILWVNEFPDYVADSRAGKRTIVVRLGRVAAARLHFGLVVFAYAWLVGACALGALSGMALAGLLSVPLSLFAALRLLGVASTHASERLLPVIKSTILAAHVHGIALAIGLLAGRHSG